MNGEVTKFYCQACGYKWEGLYIPLYCPSCKTVRQIAIDITEGDSGKED